MGAVKPVGSEDPEELVADAVAIAANTLDSCESRGKPVLPSSLAYFALQTMKSGRRSGGGSGGDLEPWGSILGVRGRNRHAQV